MRPLRAAVGPPDDGWDDAAPEPPGAREKPVPQSATGSDWPFKPIGADEIFAPLPPVNWVCEALDLCPGAPALVAGFGFSGKTLAMQSLALSMATGSPLWGAHPLKVGSVVHVDFEQGQHLSRARYQRLARGLMVGPTDIGDRLELACFPDVYLDEPSALSSFERLMVGKQLLVIDSLRAAAPGLEENSSEIRRVLDLLGRVSESTGCASIVIHHARKPSQESRGGAKAAIRGSGAIFDACSSVLVFDGNKGEPVRVSHEKARTSGKPREEFDLAIIDTDDGGVAIVEQSSGPRQSKDTDAVLALIREYPGRSLRQLREMATCQATSVDRACALLREQGLIEIKEGPRKALLHFPKGDS